MVQLVSQLQATLKAGVSRREAQRVFRSLEDELLVPRGLYLDGGLSDLAIAGIVSRADGRDLSELEVTRVSEWLAANPAIAEFSIGPRKPATGA